MAASDDLRKASLFFFVFGIILGGIFGIVLGGIIEKAASNGIEWEKENEKVVKYEGKFYKLELLKFEKAEGK